MSDVGARVDAALGTSSDVGTRVDAALVTSVEARVNAAFEALVGCLLGFGVELLAMFLFAKYSFLPAAVSQ